MGACRLLWFLPLILPGLALGQDFVPMEECGACHDEAEAFAAGPHGRAIAARDPALLERSCVACHGPGEEHFDDPLPENIVRLPGPDACASCHDKSPGLLALATPAHTRHAVACLDCHASGHAAPPEAPLLAGDPLALCGGCHRTQAAAAGRPFAHRDGNVPMACVHCHSMHGERRLGRLATSGKGEVCLDCHSAQAGPFVFPHPPREVEGCLACHQPHGSVNPRLLTRRTLLSQCLECHADVPAFHDISQARFRACQSCHTAVHGSNIDARLFEE